MFSGVGSGEAAVKIAFFLLILPFSDIFGYVFGYLAKYLAFMDIFGYEY